MVIIDLILICTDLGIPLNKVREFIIDDNVYDVEIVCLANLEIEIAKYNYPITQSS